jgi:putative ABC transport system permease protein
VPYNEEDAMRLVHSVRLHARTLFRAPAFALTATATLALGIGLSTAVFTVAEALLIRKLPVLDQDRLITLWAEKRDGSVGNWPLDLKATRELTRDARTLQAVAYFAYEGAWPVAIRDGENITRLRRALVSGNWFDVLGAHALVGRTLRPADDVVGATPVVVISHATWQRQFGADPSVVGRTLTLEEFGVAATIVGVMPPGLEYPTAADFWAPFVPSRLRSENDTTAYTALDLVGRLAPNATADNAQSELTAYFTHPGALASSPLRRQLRGVAHSLPRVILGDTRPAVLVFAAAAALLLLLTCINVANLLLVRGLARLREIGIRAALGASQSQIITQLFTENAILAVAGGAVGMLVAWVAVRSFIALAPADVPLLNTVHLNMAALVAALVITMVAMLLFGLVPALVTARADIHAVLRSGTRQSASRGARIARETLVATQIALALLVLSAAALIARSFVKLRNADLEFDSSHLLIAELAIHYDQYGTAEQQLPLIRELVAQLRSTPGVEAVSPVVAMPFSGTGGWTGRAGIEGQSPDEAAKNPMFNMDVVTPDYFRTFGLRVLRGRAFTDVDQKGTEPVVVVSETTARQYWPNQDPIGKRLYLGSKPDERFTVVGVVPDTRYRDLREARASVYYPLTQSPFGFAPTTLAVRAAGSPASLVPTVRRVINEAVPGVALASAAPFDTYMKGPLSQPRLNAFLLAVFAFVAATLAAIGLFGAMATMVRQRTRELGIRMALGATSRDIQSIVIGRGLAIAGAGVGVGLVGAVVANRLLSSLLYHVSATDAATLGGAALFLTTIALLASLIPSRSSARIDPALALRSDG